MRLTLDRLLSYISPHQCMACGIDGALLCSRCLPLLPEIEPQCYRCKILSPGFTTCEACSRGTSLEALFVGTDYDFFAKQLIHNLKFDHTIEAARLIAQYLIQYIVQLPKDTYLVPVPTASNRIRQRGYDQAVLIAKQLSHQSGLPYRNLLRRTSTIRQTTLSRAKRLQHKDTLFSLRISQTDQVRSVLLIDDVVTTGATLEAAAATCSNRGIAHIQALTFASGGYSSVVENAYNA